MKTLHRYLTRQMLATLGMTVFVFTLLLLLGNVIKELLHLVVNRQASLGLALHAIGLLIPYLLAWSLPIGMLTASLLVFGRISADQELTAARASGISLISLITPVLVLSVAVSGLCAWLNFDIAPANRMEYKILLYKAGVERPADLLLSNESMPVDAYHTIWVSHRDGTNLENVKVFRYDTNGIMDELIESHSGTLVTDETNHQIVLTLQDAQTMQHFSDGWKPGPGGNDVPFYVKMETQARKAVPLPISDMTFRQLLDKRKEIEHSLSEPPAKGLTSVQLKAMQGELRKAATDMTTPLLVYLHREVAFSFACIGFTLVGIPLGIRAHRRETSVGVATALVLMLIYYSFLVLAQAWANHSERDPYLIVWIPNFIFQSAGAVLLWRANKGV